MAHSKTFGERFGYLLWLSHLEKGWPPRFGDIGDVVGRSDVAVGAWRKAAVGPTDRETQEALGKFFGVDERWLATGKGEPPKPELWPAWERARREQAPAPTIDLVAAETTRGAAAAKEPGQRSRGVKAKHPRPQSGKRRAG